MKFRTGFVSNSSSSSFIIVLQEFWSDEPLLSQQEIKCLQEFGFQQTNGNLHSLMDSVHAGEPIEEDTDGSSLGFAVSCNEDDVVEFLLQHGIPFKALIHYGHAHYFYERGAKEVLVLPNHGEAYAMYGVQHVLPDMDPTPYQRPLTDWISEDSP